MAFEFIAVVRNDGPTNSLYRLTTDTELGEDLTRTFTIPAGRWQEPEMQRATFAEGYALAEKEIFEIKDFKLPAEMLNALRFPQELSAFDANTRGIADLKAIIAVENDNGRITAIVKIVSAAKKLMPTKNLTILCTNQGYIKQTDPGMMIDDRIAAVYLDGTLLFRAPGTVRQVLSLKDYMQTASDLEIIAFLEQRFETDTEKILAVADTWMRKRFAALMESTLFDERSALDIYDAAQSFSAGIPLEMSKDRTKLVLPEDKQDIRMILKFLNEEYYKGVLTGKDFQTPSKRPLQNADEHAGGQRKRELSFAG